VKPQAFLIMVIELLQGPDHGQWAIIIIISRFILVMK
jgi:hypothetical protein